MATNLAWPNALLPVHFFKIILKTNIERLKIPSKFTRRCGGGLSNPMIIKPPDGTKWKVYWTKQNGEVWLEKGWKKFAENYSLDHGHLVLFKYQGTSVFDVLILDQSAVEIDYHSLNPRDEEDKLDNLHHCGDDSIRILEEISPLQKARPKSPLSSPPSHKKMRIDMKTTQTTSSLNWPKESRAQKIAQKFVTSNPFFTVLIKPCHLASERKHVPKFIDIESEEQDVMLQLGKRSWHVKLVCQCYRNSRYDILSSGWPLFATESKLQVGDVCIFELIHGEDREVPVLKVHVF